MRQRLTSEPDRYRGRRRVPTPPRSRYAVVVTSAFVGAGVVALGAASNLPDAKAVSPEVLNGLTSSHVAAQSVADRDNTDRASRGEARSVKGKHAKAKIDLEKAAADVWLLPLEQYTFTSPYGIRLEKLHAGIDLAGPEGTPYKAIHAGTVTQAGYNGGYGYSLTIRTDDGTEIIYAHSRRLLVKEGDRVTAGQVIGEIGNTGASFGTHLHLEIHQDGEPTDPVPFLRARGVDIQLHVESAFAVPAAS